MSFIAEFSKTAGASDVDADVARGSDPTQSDVHPGMGRNNFFPRGKGGTKNMRSGQSKAGTTGDQFWSEKEVDPQRFPAKNWINSRIPGN